METALARRQVATRPDIDQLNIKIDAETTAREALAGELRALRHDLELLKETRPAGTGPTYADVAMAPPVIHAAQPRPRGPHSTSSEHDRFAPARIIIKGWSEFGLPTATNFRRKRRQLCRPHCYCSPLRRSVVVSQQKAYGRLIFSWCTASIALAINYTHFVPNGSAPYLMRVLRSVGSLPQSDQKSVLFAGSGAPPSFVPLTPWPRLVRSKMRISMSAARVLDRSWRLQL
jgi:hypothetical protein